MVRYFLARDPDYDPFTFDPEKLRGRVLEISQLMDSTDPDLSAFRAHGGRLIMKENMSDYAQSPYAGIDYYRTVVARMGQSSVDEFIRLYAAPGANHGGRAVNARSGADMPQFLDLLAALDRWVEAGVAPADALMQTTRDGSASRPLCRYPAYPRELEQRDPKAPASFACVQP
jgi:feruloyl esterase